MTASDKRVLIGMSGGIDSSASCLMLIEQGYEPVGMTMRAWDSDSTYLDEAAQLAARLGIEHYVADVREDFRNTVVADFINEYLNGRTPNPCVMCNPMFKFRLLGEYADKHGCKMIATGHYSKIATINGLHYIERGIDSKKDQSYFLWRLDEEVLSRCIFPLGNYNKQQVREYLSSKGFEAKSKSSESMEVCFIKDDYRDFLKDHCNQDEIQEGWFVSCDGKKLGKHKGLPYYTIGQRKGLGIALGEPAYVVKLNAEKNTVMLGDKDKLRAEYMLVENYRFNNINDMTDSNRQKSVMIRYHGTPVRCQTAVIDDKHMIVRFLSEAHSISPGQSAVFYDNDILLGGGYIANQKMLGYYLSNENIDKLNFI